MAKKNERRVVPTHELDRNLLYASIRETSELVCALVAGVFVENATGHLLERCMISHKTANGLLNGHNAILNTASARTDMCFCLGLIDKITYDNAKNICKVRNRFAHSTQPIDFTDAEVVSNCRKMVFKLSVTDAQLQHIPNAEAEAQARIYSVLRYRFVLTTIDVLGYLTHLAGNQRHDLAVHQQHAYPLKRNPGSIMWYSPRTNPLSPSPNQSAINVVKDNNQLKIGPVVLFDN